MMDRSAAFEEELATWDDLNLNGTVVDDDQDPSEIDPRPIPSEIVELDKTLATLESQLSSLRLRRASLLAERALITRIPPELLSRIFEFGVHGNITLLPSLSLVSRHWRNVTVNTPVLWSYVKLDHNWGYGRMAAFLQKLTLHLERSQTTKLLIDIDFRYLDAFTDVIAIMSALEPHLHRCFSFRASVPDWDWMGAVRERSSNLGPSLEELYLRIDPSDSDDQTPITFLSSPCRRLHTIVLEHTPLTSIRTLPLMPEASREPDVEMDGDKPHIELPSLRKLHLIRDQRYHSSSRIGISFRELLSTLVSTPSLTDIRIQSAVFLLDGSEAIFHPDPVPVPIPCLSTLSFNFLDTTNMALFMESTSLPQLRRLCIQMETNNEETMQFIARLAGIPHALSVRTPLQPRFPQLRFLDLRACNTDGPALPAFIRTLHALPLLTGLAFSSPPSGNLGAKLFDLLAGPIGLSSISSPEQTGWIVPRLQALCVQNCRDVSGHELLRVVRARHGPAAPGVQDISFLKISQCYALDLEVVDLLRVLVDRVQTF